MTTRRKSIVGAGPDIDPGIWRRWMQPWAFLFYAALLMGLVLGVLLSLIGLFRTS